LGELTAPALLAQHHPPTGFCSGVDTLDEWLIRRAWKNQQNGASRTFVVCSAAQVAGYYALSIGSVERAAATGALARNMPDPIPVIVLGRLAVDQRYQGRRVGAALLRDAMLRTLRVADNVGVRALLVHAISEDARQFYLSYGVRPSAMDPMTLFLSTQYMLRHLG